MHCKCRGYQSKETVLGDTTNLCFKNFHNLFLQSDKVELDIEA